MKTILDTGPLVALLNRRDTFHRWTREALAHLASPLYACEPVLTEAAYLTKRPIEILRMVTDGALTIGLTVTDESEALQRLLQRYDGRMDLADACVVRQSELFQDSQVFTLDRRDFSIYRRNGRQAIPLLAPPVR